MHKKIIWSVLWGIFIMTSQLLLAQTKDQRDNQNYIQINSNPRGALVKISGKHTFMARTPFSIPYKLFGKYKIEAIKEGYEKVTSSVFFTQEGRKRLNISLSPKTRFKAAVRSAVFPGWGQIYSGDKIKGAFFTVGYTTLGVLSVFAIKDYINEKNDFDRTFDEFKKVETNFEKAKEKFNLVQKELQQAKDTRDRRDTLIFVTIGFWFYNILDSIFFFPQISSKIDISPEIQSPLTNGSVNHQYKMTMKIGL